MPALLKHQSRSGFLFFTTWLVHSCVDGKISSAHNPTICPVKGSDANVENVHKVTAEKTSGEDKVSILINLIEKARVKKHQNSAEETVAVIWDGASDSHWISKTFAEKLPQKNRKRWL